MARKSTSSSADTLEKVPLLEGLTKRDRQRLGRSMKSRTFPAGSQVVVEDRKGVGFFIITDGKAAVSIGSRVVDILGPGDYFGEMALIDGDRRTATVTADSDLECLSLTSWEFKPFVAEHPSVAWALLQTLARRVRENADR
jgi:CRP/FNR family transcriptional regulator, cyclic AMP receptor protein